MPTGCCQTNTATFRKKEKLLLPRPVDSHSGTRGNILAGLQTFSWGPSGKKIFEFFFSKWYILAYFLNFWTTAGLPKRRRPGVANPL